MINFDINKYGKTFNAAVNILAVEYLIKENWPVIYSSYIELLESFDDIDISILDVELSLNMHIENLGAMITQGDYDEQRDLLIEVLDRKKNTGMAYSLD